MKDWKKELRKPNPKLWVTRKDYSKGHKPLETDELLNYPESPYELDPEKVTPLIETLLEQERERVVEEIEIDLAKNMDYKWTFSQVKEYLEKYLKKKGDKE